jgi:hypothetical protein
MAYRAYTADLPDMCMDGSGMNRFRIAVLMQE